MNEDLKTALTDGDNVSEKIRDLVKNSIKEYTDVLSTSKEQEDES